MHPGIIYFLLRLFSCEAIAMKSWKTKTRAYYQKPKEGVASRIAALFKT